MSNVMEAELVVFGKSQQDSHRPMSAIEIRAGINLIQDVMRSVMQDGIHFGTIPGTQKPTLYKPGAEKILVTFRIATDPLVEDLSTPDEMRYRVTVSARSSSGLHLGSSVGECSSNEEKYRWRAAICAAEFDETPVDRRRSVWKRAKDGNGAEKINQVRTNPVDVANTILKMAVKRAKIAVTLDVTAASDIFSQDIEDLPEELREEIARDEGRAHPDLGRPSAKSAAPQKAKTPEPEGSVFVEAIRVAKTGEGNKGPWTLHAFKFSNGIECSSLNDAQVGIAKSAKAGKLPVVIEVGEYKGKPTLTSIKLAEVVAAPEPAPAVQQGNNESAAPALEKKPYKIAEVVAAAKKGDPFVIVTADGLRLTCSDHRFYITAQSAKQSGADVILEAQRDGDALTLTAIDETGA